MNAFDLPPALRSFAEAARLGSITAAAKALGLSKAAVSQHVAGLETALGAPLFHRSNHGITLNAAGERLRARVETLAGAYGALRADMADQNARAAGRFALTFPHALSGPIVMPALARLCREYPGLEPELVASDRHLDLVEARLDAAIRVGRLPNGPYRAQRIGAFGEWLCAAPGPGRGPVPVTSLADLAGLDFVAAPWQSATLTLFGPDDKEGARVRMRLRARAQAAPDALALAEAGLGLALLPEFLVRPAIEQGRLRRVLAAVSGREWPVFFVHAFGADKPGFAARFQALVRQSLQAALGPSSDPREV